jgi:hypothetical protein
MHEQEQFNKAYKFGNQSGGGAPVRDPDGNVISQHASFASIQQHGGVEYEHKPALRKSSHSPTR